MKRRVRIRMNLATVSSSILLNFSAYYSVQGLQSSLNKSVGTLSLSALYASMAISALFLTPVAVPALGGRKPMAMGTFGYSIYTMANCYVRYYTMIPSAIILGCGGAIFWVALRSYVRALSSEYSSINNADKEATTAHFFGIVMAFLSASFLVGNAIPSAVLHSVTTTAVEATSVTNDSNVPIARMSISGSKKLLDCGIHACGKGYGAVALDTQAGIADSTALYIMFGIFAALQMIAALIQWCVLTDARNCDHYIQLDDDKAVPDTGSLEESTNKISVMAKILSTAKLNIFDPTGRLLIPIAFSKGIIEGFVMGQFTRDWMTCYEGIEYVGYGISLFGIGSIIGGYGSGLLSYIMTRRMILLVALTFETATGLLLLFWEPNVATDAWIFYAAFCLYGAIYTSRKTLINASYVIFFPANKEAGSSSFTLWGAAGAAVAYLISPMICNRAYVIAMLATSTFGVSLYFAAERLRDQEQNKTG